MKILDIEQGSPEWLAARCGRVTASRIADLTAKTKSGWGASRANYAAELVAERLTGTPAEKFVSSAMAHGTEQEPQARALYEFMRDVEVVQVGFVLHPTIEMAGASPDGLVGDDGLIEIKCPNTATHIQTLLSGTIDGKYVKQMQWQMACTGRKWCDFVSFDPRLPAEMQSFIKRVPRDAVMIADLEKEVRAFLSEIDATLAQLTAKFSAAQVAA
jgi:putative phage-type endonuclease